MTTRIPTYFNGVSDPRGTGRCLHLFSDILLLGLCTYITGGTDYQDMRLLGLERSSTLGDLLSLPNGIPSVDTFERVLKRIPLQSFKTAYFNALARGYWGIENQLHWHLDVTFKEDQCRARIGY